MTESKATAGLPAVLSGLPAPITPAKLPTVAHYWRALERPDRVDAWATLIPVSDCEAIVAEIDRSLSTIASESKASELVSILVGSRPSRDIPEPDVYVRMMARVFAKFPTDLGVLAVEHIVENFRFVPTAADVSDVLKSLRAKREIARRRAEQHIAEHKRRAEAAESERTRRRFDKLSPEERRAHESFMAMHRRGEERADPAQRGTGPVRSLGAVLAGKRDEEVAA